VTVAPAAKGGISGPLYEFRPIWEDLSGGKIYIIELPFAEHYTKMMLDVRNGTGQYDAFMVGAFWYGDIVPNGYALPVDDMNKSGRFPKWSYDDMPPSLRNIYTWGGVGYGIRNDADGQVLYYRRDVLNDPKNQADFKAATGHDMVVPPKTWQQVLEISQFFNGKNWDSGDPDPDSGVVLHLKVGEQGHYHFQSLSASFAITPGPTLDRYHNVYWFDPTDMTPLINIPGHIKALEFLQELHKNGPSAEVGWSLGEAWDYFLRGKAVFVFSWGDVGGLCEDTRARDQGQMRLDAAAGIDGLLGHGKEAVGPHRQPRAGRQHDGRLLAGRGLLLFQEPGGDLFLPVAHGDQAGLKMFATIGWDGVDPGYKYQMLKPDGDATIEDYTSAGWDANDVKDYLNAYYQNFNSQDDAHLSAHPRHVRILGQPDKNLSAAMAGQMTARRRSTRRPTPGSRSPTASVATRSSRTTIRQSAISRSGARRTGIDGLRRPRGPSHRQPGRRIFRTSQRKGLRCAGPAASSSSSSPRRSSGSWSSPSFRSSIRCTSASTTSRPRCR
jgi:multiple sugar transport system substrate-binding protein